MAKLVITRVLLPAAVIITEEPNLKCKRTELPIYLPERDQKKSAPVKSAKDKEVDKNSIIYQIEDGIGTVRKSLYSMVRNVKHLESAGMDKIDEGRKNVQWLVDYLGDEGTDVAPKAGAIAIGGLTGLILALRGGFFRKLIFTSAGAFGMASICYPNESAEYSSIAFAESKQYAKIGYNFIYGVKKGDPPLELPSLPKLPTSISEVWGIVAEIGKSSDKASPVLEMVKEEKVVREKHVADDVGFETSNEDNVDDTIKTVSDIHDESLYKSCHCPIGACLNPHEESHTPVVPDSSGAVNPADPLNQGAAKNCIPA